MMQRHGRAADFLDQFLAACLNLIQVRRTKWFVSRFRKNQIRRLEVAYWPVVRGGQCVDLLRDPQRCLANFIVRPNIADDCRINSICEHDHSIIPYFRSVLSVGESARNYDAFSLPLRRDTDWAPAFSLASDNLLPV